MRTTIMEVDIDKFYNNIDLIQKYVGNKKIMPIIKANGYGTYINKKLEVLNKFDIVGVAIVEEAIELRKLGYKKEIFALNQPYIEDIEDIIKYDITIGVGSVSFLDKILNIRHKIRVHLEIETGMNRTGMSLEELKCIVSKLKEKTNIVVDGVYTHLSSADCDMDYTNYQLNIFKKAISIVKNNFNDISYIHSCASNGLLNFNDSFSNLVRVGIIMYGYESFKGAREKINFEPICKLKTKVTFIKMVDKGQSISYSRKFIAKEKMRVATIPIGYADGFRRELFDIGEVVVNGKRAKIVGTICMDSCMIDVTGIEDVVIGSDVYIWDNEIITVDEIAQKCGTINYEVISTISYRVPRLFIGK